MTSKWVASFGVKDTAYAIVLLRELKVYCTKSQQHLLIFLLFHSSLRSRQSGVFPTTILLTSTLSGRPLSGKSFRS